MISLTQRIFVSDINHHRIIVANANGGFLDCIGSSPGLRKDHLRQQRYTALLHPLSVLIKIAYIADYEEHALRRQTWRRERVPALHHVMWQSLFVAEMTYIKFSTKRIFKV